MSPLEFDFMCFGHETGGSGLEETHVDSATVMVYWRMCQLWPQ